MLDTIQSSRAVECVRVTHSSQRDGDASNANVSLGNAVCVGPTLRMSAAGTHARPWHFIVHVALDAVVSRHYSTLKLYNSGKSIRQGRPPQTAGLNFVRSNTSPANFAISGLGAL